MSIVLSQVGWAAHKLEGGYKTYRRDVLEKLEALPANLTLRVICGPTGSGKSRLLAVLAETGQQVLDLEKLARHRGSVLGKLPEQAQPSQKSFESALLQTLQTFDPARPVYAEAESKKIGSIILPAALVAAMHASPCLLLETPLTVRIAGLQEDYRHFIDSPETLLAQLQVLHPFHGSKRLEHWSKLAGAGDFATLVEELLTLHYDPSYFRATSRNYPQLTKARRFAPANLTDATLRQLATEIVKNETA